MLMNIVSLIYWNNVNINWINIVQLHDRFKKLLCRYNEYQHFYSIRHSISILNTNLRVADVRMVYLLSNIYILEWLLEIDLRLPHSP